MSRQRIQSPPVDRSAFAGYRFPPELMMLAVRWYLRYGLNNRVECDHGRLRSRLRPMRGLKTDRTASVVIRGHAFIQNLRRGRYELGADARHQHLRAVAAIDELTATI
jgi:transposase-like protein